MGSRGPTGAESAGRRPAYHMRPSRIRNQRVICRRALNQWDFLAGTKAQLAAVWQEYGIYAQVEQGVVDHTPALFVIDQPGRKQRIYLTAMAYSSISQQAQILARQISRLLAGHPALSRHCRCPRSPRRR